MKKKNIGKMVAAVFIASMFLVSSTMVVNAGTRYSITETIDEKEIDVKAEIPEQEPSLYDAYEDKLDNVKPDIDAAKPDIDANDDASSPDLELSAQNSMQLQPKVKTSPKKYAVIMVGRYFGLWYYGHPLWNYNMIQQYYTWYLNDAGNLYTILTDIYGYDEENIFVLVRLLPDYFEIPDSFDPDWIDYTSSEENLEVVLNTFKEGGENELNEGDSLFVCFIDHGATEKWLSPNYHIDNDWDDEGDAYDEDTSTCAVFDEDQGGNSDWLILTMDKPITIKGFRICAKNRYLYDKMEIRFYKGSSPYPVKTYSCSSWPNKDWKNVIFGSKFEVDKVKIRFHENYLIGFSLHPAKVYEFDFRPADDIGNTYFGCPLLTIPDFLRWIFGSDVQQLYDYELANYVDNINAKIIFALQPCFSGGFIDDLSGENRIICTASQEDEKAFAGWIGPFTRAFGGEGNPDYNDDGKISIFEAYLRSVIRVEEQIDADPNLGPQHPLIDDNGDGIGHYYNDTGYVPTPGEDGFLAYMTYLGVINYPPNKPRKPECDTWGGYRGIEYTFDSNTTDPELDEIYYLFDWDDGTVEEWIGPYTSEEIVEASHIWTENGTYYVRVKAKDEVYDEHESSWSEPFEMQIGEDEDSSSTQNEMTESDYNNASLH